jgi:pyridoxamine 5'-phosphate oxidase
MAQISASVSAPDPIALSDILAATWATLGHGVASRNSGFHHASLANVDRANKPRSRTVIVREINSAAKTVRFHTDIRSAKWGEFAVNPKASVLFYDPAEKLQIRVDGDVTLHHQDAVSDQAWSTSQRMSQLTYGINPGPGTPISDHNAFGLPPLDNDEAIAAGRANFGVILLHISTLEYLSLKVRGNRRALFDFTKDTAQWLTP